jgi:hypothetical protein
MPSEPVATRTDEPDASSRQSAALLAVAYWNNEKVNLNRNNPDNSNDKLRVRASVEVFVLYISSALSSLYPAAKHPSYLTNHTLYLENPGFIGQF